MEGSSGLNNDQLPPPIIYIQKYNYMFFFWRYPKQMEHMELKSFEN